MSEARHANHDRQLRVFLSHSSADVAFARKLRNLLFERANAQVFTDEDLSAGEDWITKLRLELDVADVVVALLTPASVDSKWVLHEIGAAWALEKPIVSVITRRDLLNKMPAALNKRANVIELVDVESARNADRFVKAFEDSVAAAHAA
jgi:nucleoside 2-deoxyribosyltransferase